MDSLHKSLNEAVGALPEIFLGRLIARKLKEQGVAAPKWLPGKIAKHFLTGNAEPFTYRGGTQAGNVTLTLTETDTDEVTRALELFCETQLSDVLHDVAGRIAKRVLKDLKSRWPNEYALQETDFSEFRERLEGRWGQPLGQLRMLLTIAREWCQTSHNLRNLKANNNKQLSEILLRLLVRACQVTDEIICLLHNGFADGAMARWRTLHEIGVVAAVISRHGEDIALRYLAHQAIESKRGMNKYLSCYQDLGYKPLPARAVTKITKAYNAAIATYGKDFDADYGWATLHLKKKRVTFSDLEKEAGRAEMRSHYQMGNDNVHAGIKSMYVRLGLLDDYQGLLAGRSNVGLMEPGQNAAHTLTQISVLVCLSEESIDDLVTAETMRMLRDGVPRSFFHADKRLRRDDKKYKSAGKSSLP